MNKTEENKMKKKIIISLFILVVIIGAVLGFTVFQPGKNRVPQYKKEAVQKGDIESLVVTTGTLNPVTIVEVGSQVSGKIEEIKVDFNSVVKEGQVIAKIEQSSFLTRVKQDEANYQSSKASLEKAKINLENYKKKHDRALDLFEKDLISYEEKESAETQYFSALADVESAEAKLEQTKSQLESSRVDLAYTIIKSPIDGVVISRNVNVGQTVAASFQAPVLFTIANDLTKMQVECSVDEADIGKVKEAQKVRFSVDAFPDESFTGTVSQVRYSPEIIQNVVTYTTIVEVENPKMKLRPGMTATVSVIVGEADDTLLVPNSALRFTLQLSQKELKKIFEDWYKEREEGSLIMQPGLRSAERTSSGLQEAQIESAGQKNDALVWAVDENEKLKPIPIKTGVTDNSYTEVAGGNLKEGQEVITGIMSGKESTQSSMTGDSMRNMLRMMR